MYRKRILEINGILIELCKIPGLIQEEVRKNPRIPLEESLWMRKLAHQKSVEIEWTECVKVDEREREREREPGNRPEE